MHKSLAIFTLGAAVLASCGSSGSSTSATTKAATETTKAPVTTAATTATTTATTATTTATTAKATTPTSAAAAPSVAVTLSEWKIEAGAVKAGKVTLDAKNTGAFPHELKVIKGSFADLAKGAGGSVAEDQLVAGAVVGKADRIGPGASATLSVDLPAGKYTLVCNIVGGGVSHAAKGQVLDITVA